MSITVAAKRPSSLDRIPSQVREREILRVSVSIRGEDSDATSKLARDEVLRWAQTKAVSKFGEQAWRHEPFEQLASGRSRVVVCIDEKDAQIWAIRVEDPDRAIAGRIWTTEIVVTNRKGQQPKITLRLLVGSREQILDLEPHVPGVIRQLINKIGLEAGAYRLTDKPMTITTEAGVNLLIDALVDKSRTLPIIVVSVPEWAGNPHSPLIDPTSLAQACAGLAIVLILPAQFTWNLSDRFGQRLSVFGGAIRVYLQGFTDDANPFGGHDLILPDRFDTAEGIAITLKRLRWAAALGSVTRLALGTDLVPFGSLRLQSLEQQQRSLKASGASEQEQLATALETIKVLEERVAEENRFQTQFSALHDHAEERASSAEAQLSASGFRIQQLLAQLQEVGATPDATIQLPENWQSFAEWCDVNLAGRVTLSPQARRGLSNSVFEDVKLAARCLLWLANELRKEKTEGSNGSLRDRPIESGIINAPCGSDTFEIEWQSRNREVDWHVKNGGNTRDPRRCLRIYYFWDDSSQQAVIASMPEHRRTDAS